jgi:hypothetical protein
MVMKWEYANGGFVYLARVFRHQPPYPTSVEWLLETIIGLSQPSGRFLGFITTVFKKRISKNGFWYIPTILKKFARKLSIIHWFFHENCRLFLRVFENNQRPGGLFGSVLCKEE